MKLSKDTIAIFKNYASINRNILLKEGNILATRSEPPTIASEVTVPETFPIDFGIYDLHEFLGALYLFDDPELEFNDKFVSIKENGNTIKFYASDPNVLATPKKSITFPDVDIQFELSTTQLSTIQRTASVLGADDLSFIGKDGTLTLQVSDKKNATGNLYETVVGNTDLNFRVNLKINNLKLMQGDYTVSISNKKISRFTSKNENLIYYVAVESDSVF